MMPGLSSLVGFAGGGIGGSFSATVSPLSITRTGGTSGTGSQTLTTAPAVVTPHGGSGSATYAWSLVSGDPITITSPSAASTTFSATLFPDNDVIATFQCLVTDASGATATVTVSVEISLQFYGRYL